MLLEQRLDTLLHSTPLCSPEGPAAEVAVPTYTLYERPFGSQLMSGGTSSQQDRSRAQVYPLFMRRNATFAARMMANPTSLTADDLLPHRAPMKGS